MTGVRRRGIPATSHAFAGAKLQECQHRFGTRKTRLAFERAMKFCKNIEERGQLRQVFGFAGGLATVTKR